MIKLKNLYFKLVMFSAVGSATLMGGSELESMDYKINELTPAKFSASERDVLKERFIEFELLRDIPIPTGWKLNFSRSRKTAC